MVTKSEVWLLSKDDYHIMQISYWIIIRLNTNELLFEVITKLHSTKKTRYIFTKFLTSIKNIIKVCVILYKFKAI